MKKRTWILLALAAALLLPGCMSHGEELPLESIAPDIGPEVAEMLAVHILGGQREEWTINAGDIEGVRSWAASLECEPEPVESDPAPGDTNGGEVYTFSWNGGDRYFSYVVNGENESYLLMDGKWYPARNPSHPPVALAAADDPWGISLSVTKAGATGVTLLCKQSGGEMITGELQTGSPFFLEVHTGNGWLTMEAQTAEGWLSMEEAGLAPEGLELAWTMEAWMIPMAGSVEWEADWQWLYGALPDGHYRIGKSIMDFRGPGDYDQRTYWAEFDITDGAAAPSSGEEAVTVRGMGAGNDMPRTLTVEDAGTIRALLENGDWQEGTGDCLNDCFLTVGGAEIGYHSSCGTFNDGTNVRSLSLSDEEQAAVNAVLEQYVMLSYPIESFETETTE